MQSNPRWDRRPLSCAPRCRRRQFLIKQLDHQDGTDHMSGVSVSRSKRLLKPHPLPHQQRVLELRTSLVLR